MNTISVEDLKRRMENGEQICLLDVREDFERTAFNIGGVHIPLFYLQSSQAKEIQDWKNKEVIVYCRIGHRSGKAAEYLESIGFINTANLEGGMVDWQSKFMV